MSYMPRSLVDEITVGPTQPNPPTEVWYDTSIPGGSASDYVAKSGDTMTGNLNVPVVQAEDLVATNVNGTLTSGYYLVNEQGGFLEFTGHDGTTKRYIAMRPASNSSPGMRVLLDPVANTLGPLGVGTPALPEHAVPKSFIDTLNPDGYTFRTKVFNNAPTDTNGFYTITPAAIGLTTIVGAVASVMWAATYDGTVPHFCQARVSGGNIQILFLGLTAGSAATVNRMTSKTISSCFVIAWGVL